MKQILASLLAAYTLTNGQTPPGTTAGPAAVATAAAAGTTAAPVATAPVTIIPVVEPPPPPLPPVVTTAQTTAVPQAVPQVVSAAPAPPTPQPTTGRPTPQPTMAPTYNPYCPMPAVLGSQHGVTSGTFASSNQGCISPYERAVAFNGKVQCSKFACCQCAEIQCGDPFGLACDELIISDSGAVGNQNINVLGDMTSAFGGNSFAGIGGAMNNGAEIRCNGIEACKASKIYGKYVGQMSCAGDMGCAGSNVLLEDPGEQFQFQCNGMMSCMNMNLEIVITPNSQVYELGTIEFNGQQSAQGMTITIRNEAQHPVMLQNLECMNPTACPNLRINIIGNLFIENCDLQHMNIQTAGASLLAACQAGGAGQGNFFPGMGMPQPMPQVPVNPYNPYTPPAPVNPTPVNPTPVNPAPVNPYNPPVQAPPATNPAPVNPTPVNPAVPAPGAFNPYPAAMPFFDPNQLTCDFGQCRGRVITMTPAHGFKLICDKAGQCDGMTLNLNMGGGMAFAGFMTEIYSLKFSVPTRGVTININGFAEVNDIRCEVIGACNGLKINGPQIDQYALNMDCQQPGSCQQCSVNGMDCNMLAMQQGNNGGFGGYGGYGYGNPYGVQPQQPQAYNPYAQPQPYNPWI